MVLYSKVSFLCCALIPCTKQNNVVVAIVVVVAAFLAFAAVATCYCHRCCDFADIGVAESPGRNRQTFASFHVLFSV